MEIEDQKNFFYKDLIWLNINIYIIKKIRNFPWRELELHLTFWNFSNSLFKNYFENSIIIIRRLYFETNNDFVSLKFLKNQVLKGKDEIQREPIVTKLKTHELFLTSIENKINDLRNYKLGHRSRKLTWEESKNYNLGLNQLYKSVTSLNEIYRILFELDPQSRFITENYFQDERISDIEMILDCIARNSEILKMNEMKPDTWKSYLKKWNKEGSLEKRLKAINKYREKIWNLNPIN